MPSEILRAEKASLAFPKILLINPLLFLNPGRIPLLVNQGGKSESKDFGAGLYSLW